MFNLDVTNASESVMALCNVLDNADYDVHFLRNKTGKTSYCENDAGERIELPRFGKRFYLPYEECDSKDWEQPVIVAGVDDYKDDDSPGGPVSYLPDGWKFLDAFDPDEVEIEPEVDLLPDDALLESLLQPPPHEPNSLGVPVGPSAAACELRELSHANYEPWCQQCVAGKSGEDKHSRKAKDSELDRKRVDFDLQFFNREGQKVQR